MFEDNILPKAHLLSHVVIDVEFKLYLLRLSSCFEDKDVGSIGFSLILDKRFLKFVVEFKITSRKDLED